MITPTVQLTSKFTKTRVIIRALRNFAFNSRVGFVPHEQHCSQVITDGLKMLASNN